MSEVYFTFWETLGDFLKPHQRGQQFVSLFSGRQSIKHLIEALGVPHTEVGAITVNGQSAGLNDITMDRDHVEVFPASVQTDTPRVGELGFILDNHLGRLAAYLRMFGFDILYRNDFQDEELARRSAEEGRILLTRDRRLLMRKQVSRGYCVRSLEPQEQVAEVLRRFGLASEIRPFRRCLRCNGLLAPVSKEEVVDRLEPLTRRYFHEFHQCSECGQVYWKGSHYQRMLALVERALTCAEDKGQPGFPPTT